MTTVDEQHGAEGVPDDATLIPLLRAGDEAAYEHLIRSQGPRMLAVARRFMVDDDLAQDVVQEAFVAAFRSVDRFREGSQLSTWLHRIVVNAALMRLRTRRRKPEESIDPLLPRFDDTGHPVGTNPGWAPSADEALQREEVRQMVRKSIDELPETYRAVLLLRDIEELDTAETAAMLGVTPNAVKVRLHRARQALRTLLDPVVRGKEAS